MRALLKIVGSALLLSWISCRTASQFYGPSKDHQLLKEIASNPIFTTHHTGFALYDPLREEWLCQYNADKYFTPASNTKILTLLTCLHVLGDSIETLRYTIIGDSLIFRGMADPSFLFSGVPSSRRPFEVLQQHHGRVFYQAGEEIDHYGSGWAWDDYPFTFQVEKSAFPLYGNRMNIGRNALGELKISPEYFADYVQFDPEQLSLLTRDPIANAFALNEVMVEPGDILEIPFVISEYEITRILADTLHRKVDLLYDDETRDTYTAVYGASRDTLLKHMMQVSDNFIAEQLLMQCAEYMRGTFQSDSALAVAQSMIMNAVPDTLQWVDGSGLSRYNLITPRSLVWMLDQLMQLQSMNYLAGIFSAGGRSGTLSDMYDSDPPYIYAKTGTLRNQHCLSGYLRADTGKWLIFSFMHNNFTRDSEELKKEMEKILLRIKAKY